jgi:hypothetical protein
MDRMVQPMPEREEIAVIKDNYAKEEPAHIEVKRVMINPDGTNTYPTKVYVNHINLIKNSIIISADR